MDRIVIPCSKCGRPLAALPTMARRKCAACGATTKIAPAQRAQAIPLGDAATRLAASAKPPQFDAGKTVVVKRRAARPATGIDGEE